MTITRVRPPKFPPCATCGAPKDLHIRGFVWPRQLAEDVHDGAIDGFVAANGRVMIGGIPRWTLHACKYKKPKAKATKRSIRTNAIKEQRQGALAAGFHPRTGHGSDSVFYAPDGTVGLVGESKHTRAMGAEAMHAALEQARQYCRTERGTPLPALLWTTKPGPGRKAYRFLVVNAEEWPDIVDRLRG